MASLHSKSKLFNQKLIFSVFLLRIGHFDYSNKANEKTRLKDFPYFFITILEYFPVIAPPSIASNFFW